MSERRDYEQRLFIEGHSNITKECGRDSQAREEISAGLWA
jgi:hypothetical protein